MGNDITSNAQSNNYYDTLTKAGLSSNQLSRLDALNGQKGGKVIDKDVFTIAQSILNNVELQGDIAKNSALIQEVMDIMHGDIDTSKINEEYQATPMTGISPDTLMQGLHLSQDQIDKLLALSTEMTGNENTIDRGIASAVICIVRGQPAPNGIPESLNTAIQEILGEQQKQNSQFGF